MDQLNYRVVSVRKMDNIYTNSANIQWLKYRGMLQTNSSADTFWRVGQKKQYNDLLLYSPQKPLNRIPKY